MTPDQDHWEARSVLEVGLIITRYLRDNPPPEQTDFVAKLTAIADNFETVGRRDLRNGGSPRLRVVREVRP